MTTLYHYCSVHSLLAILTSKKLWMSDCSKMNDSQEGFWADQIVREILNEHSSSMSDDDRDQFITGYNINRPRPFLFCLSSEPDILSQWRAYAMNGTGVAIGFDASIFPRHKLLPHTYASPWDNTSLWPVIYNAIEQRELVGAMFNNALVSPDICVKDGGRPNYQILGALIAAVNPVLKNPAFSEEKEWRVIHSPQITTNAENKHDVLGSNSYALRVSVTSGADRRSDRDMDRSSISTHKE